MIFLSLEDEFGTINIIVWPTLVEKQRAELMNASLLGVYGIWQSKSGVRNLIAKRLVDCSHLLGQLDTKSRNFTSGLTVKSKYASSASISQPRACYFAFLRRKRVVGRVRFRDRAGRGTTKKNYASAFPPPVKNRGNKHASVSTPATKST